MKKPRIRSDVLNGATWRTRSATGFALALVVGCGEVVPVTPPAVERNHRPVIVGPSTTFHHNDTCNEVIQTYDPDGDSVTIGVVRLPDWLAFDTVTHVLHGFPGEESIGSHDLVVTATDGLLHTTDTFEIIVLLAPCLERAVFDDATTSEYVMPFPVGSTAEVLQTYCSVGNAYGSHIRDNQLAVDFRTEFGRTVVAARGGRVSVAVDNWTDSDKDDSHFNFLVIEHDDSSFAFYAHLEHESFLVQVGDRVTQGQPIASSGESGTPTGCAAFMECAVLHFGVYRRSWALDIPVNFVNADGPTDDRGGLVLGANYTALP